MPSGKNFKADRPNKQEVYDWYLKTGQSYKEIGLKYNVPAHWIRDIIYQAMKNRRFEPVKTRGQRYRQCKYQLINPKNQSFDFPE